MRCWSLCLLLFCIATVCAEPFDYAKANSSIGDVSFLGQGLVRTGSNSRVELEFPDQTIVRIGSNADFRFITGSREMVMESGTVLFSSPKGTQGGTIRAGGIVVRASGADLQVYHVAGRVKVICITGKALVYFSADPRIRDGLIRGQMLDILAGATKLPRAETINIELLLSTSLLMQMGTLRSQPVIVRNINHQKPRPVSLVNTPPLIASSRASAAAGSTRAIEAQASAQLLAAQQLAQQEAARQARQLAAQQAQQALQVSAQQLATQAEQERADRNAREQAVRDQTARDQRMRQQQQQQADTERRRLEIERGGLTPQERRRLLLLLGIRD